MSEYDLNDLYNVLFSIEMYLETYKNAICNNTILYKKKLSLFNTYIKTYKEIKKYY